MQDHGHESLDATDFISGKLFHPAMRVPLGWQFGASLPALRAEAPRFTVCLIRAGSAVLAFPGCAVPVAAPCVVLLDEQALPTLHQVHALQLCSLQFHPAYINNLISPAMLRDPALKVELSGSSRQDLFILERFVKLDGTARVFALSPHAARQIEQLMQAVIHEADCQPDKFWPCRTRSFLIELLFQLRLLEPTPLPVLPEPPAGDARSQRIGRALSFVQEHYQQDFTLGEMARACATNRTTLNEEFRVSTGMSVRAYAINLRMQMAAALLRDTKIPVAEVMSRVGYTSQSHFTRAFRQALGEPPREYRSKHCIL